MVHFTRDILCDHQIRCGLVYKWEPDLDYKWKRIQMGFATSTSELILHEIICDQKLVCDNDCEHCIQCMKEIAVMNYLQMRLTTWTLQLHCKQHCDENYIVINITKKIANRIVNYITNNVMIMYDNIYEWHCYYNSFCMNELRDFSYRDFFVIAIREDKASSTSFHNYNFGFFIYLCSCFPEDEQSLCLKRRFQIFNAVINPKALWTFWTTAEA